jgi:ferric-dicitrate binding protein FerR (iron transport regulator)
MEYTFDIDELIAKRLAAETDAGEDAQLDQWLRESPDNQRYFAQMQRLWQQSERGQQALPRPLDVEAALARTKEKIQQQPVQKARIVRFPSMWMAAAAVFVLLAAALWFFQNPADETPVMIAASETRVQDTLSDGSVVALNQQSLLSATFNKNSRRIKMRGEAYFQVAHNPEKPFVIDVKQVEVTVIGTKFNIDNRSDSSKVVVSVEEGKVKVSSGGEVIYLTVGEQASIDCVSGAILRSKLPPSGNVKGWFDRRFVFDDVPLSEVLPILEKAYDARIELKNKELGKCRLTTRFPDISLEQAIAVIAETFSLQVENNQGRYLLNGAGCQ